MSREDTQFKPGQSGNLNGRPKGARTKLSEAFLEVLAKDFSENGLEAVEAVRADKPEAYLSVIGRLMPKLMELSGPDGDSIPLSGVVKYVKSGKDEI